MYCELTVNGYFAVFVCNLFSLFADTRVGRVRQMSEVRHSVLLERTQHVDTKNSRSAAGMLIF